MDFLEFKVHALRDHLTETSTRLHQTLQENERLRVMNSTKTSPVEHEIQHSDVSSRSRENPKQNPHLKISQLRKCLTAAEADLAKQQEAMDVLKHRLEDYGSNRSTTSATVSPNMQRNELDRFPEWDKLLVLIGLFILIIIKFSPIPISQRLVSLLKVQVGALSKVLHSSHMGSPVNEKFQPLRKQVDGLIKTVAGIDENSSQTAKLMEKTFDEVINAYEKVRIGEKHIVYKNSFS